MTEYHKIQTVFKRDMQSKNKTLIEGDWSLPEFEVLQNIDWVWTEKIDGTNIRICWDGEKVIYKGRTEDAHVPTHLLRVLQEKFSIGIMKGVFGDKQVCLYGEGYGLKIQKGGERYISDGSDFILFDVKVDTWWLTRENIEGIANSLCVGIVPVVGKGPLREAIEYVRGGFASIIAQDQSYNAEGLIMKPAIDVFTRNGERIIAKLKTRDLCTTHISKTK